jgi:transposase
MSNNSRVIENLVELSDSEGLISDIFTPKFRIVAGLDVHLASITACVMRTTEDSSTVRYEIKRFGTFKTQLVELSKWLKDSDVEAITMESTGVYWKSPFRTLEDDGFKPNVVNASHVKGLRGNKTDKKDSIWLAKLTLLDSISGSFIPPAQLDRLRVVARQIHNITKMVSAEKNRLAKIFADVGVRLSAVVSDVHGVAATRMAECLIEGGTPEQALKAAGKHKLRASDDVLLEALRNDLTVAHRLTLRSILNNIRELQKSSEELEDFLYSELSEEYQWAIDLLQTMPGIDIKAALLLIVETGSDMSVFGSPAKLASWAGLCPGQNESADKRRPGRIRKGNKYVRRILTEAAHAASRTNNCMFKQKYESLIVTRGRKRSIIAIAHKMLRIMFMMLKNKEPYKDPQIDFEKLRVVRNAPRWIRALRKYGLLGSDVVERCGATTRKKVKGKDNLEQAS